MTKRIKQHQLEDLSRHKFGLAIPKKWVYRDKDKDYGIDGEVEIFNSKERATGLVFWVQLKATGSKQQRTIKGIDLSLETIRYYKSLDLPVLIARYSEVEDQFYVKWATQIDPFYAKDGAKTMRVTFSDSDILDEGKVIEIEEYLQQLRAIRSGAIKLPINVNLSFGGKSICGIPPSLLLPKIRSQIPEFKDILQLHKDAEGITADVHIDETTLKVGFLDIAGCTFHSVDLMDKLTLPVDLIKDICLSLSMALSQLGYSDLAARIVFSGDLKKRLKDKHGLLQYLMPSLLKTSYFSETLDLVNDVCDNEEGSNYLETITSSSLLFLRSSLNTEKLSALEDFLKRNIDRCKDTEPRLYGVSHYNLGNFYRSIDRLKDAVRCHLVARRYEPKYYNQGYFYGELAGMLFDLGKFNFSAKFYKKAMEIDNQKEYKPLYADALMFSGQYQQSLEVFNNFIDSGCSAAAEWKLKSICLSSLIEKYNIKLQNRSVKSALALSGVCSVKAESVEPHLEKALEQDMLCGLAWFNLGNHRSRIGEIEGAAFCFTICALVQRWDIEAWVNATACSFNNVVPLEILVLLIRAAYSCNGDKYIESLYMLFENQLGEEALSKVAQVIEQVIHDDKKSESTPALRMLNADGKFEDILSTKKA
jgi:tetratricopeptide (TPR) repeat protein